MLGFSILGFRISYEEDLMRAIISVSDKSGVTDFARGLAELGYDSFQHRRHQKVAGGSRHPRPQRLRHHRLPRDTGRPCQDPAPHDPRRPAGAARPETHMDELAKNKITPIDLVAVNLYPFVQTVSKAGVALQEALENIDIGGPTMIRASAKNFPGVIVVVDPADYDMVLEKLKSGGLDMAERKRLAQKAFQHVAVYDTAISQYLRQDMPGFPEEMTIALKKRYDLRYGENPHQKAAFYAEQTW